MNIVVLLKQTFDTEEKIFLENGEIREEGVEWIINPYDEYAVEEALRWKEQLGGEVTVISLGPPRAEKAIRTALAMGADRGVLIEEGVIGDEWVVSHLLAAAVQREAFDIVFAGHFAIDDGAAQGGARVAELLGIPQITTVTSLRIDPSQVTAQRDVEGAEEVIEAGLPVLITTQQGLNEPRYPSLPGIMKAKKKPLTRLSVDELKLPTEAIHSKTERVEVFLPPPKEAGQILQGEMGEQVNQLIHLLRIEAKVI